MISSINEFSYRLNQIDLSETGKVANSLREILQRTSPDTLLKAHKTIFRFFEDHPNVQLLGHFLDIFDDHFRCYTNELVDSIDRKPSTSTLLMANRHLNDDLNDDLRDRVMRCLLKASLNDNASEAIRKEASHYFERQNHLEWNDLVLPVADRKAPDSALITASTKKLRGRYVILRGFMVPNSVMQIEERRFGLVAKRESMESGAIDWQSLPIHLFVVIELPSYLRAWFRNGPMVVEGHLSFNVKRTSEGTVTTVYRIMAKRLVSPGD